jgi:hypothetical protein
LANRSARTAESAAARRIPAPRPADSLRSRSPLLRAWRFRPWPPLLYPSPSAGWPIDRPEPPSRSLRDSATPQVATPSLATLARSAAARRIPAPRPADSLRSRSPLLRAWRFRPWPPYETRAPPGYQLRRTFSFMGR